MVSTNSGVHKETGMSNIASKSGRLERGQGSRWVHGRPASKSLRLPDSHPAECGRVAELRSLVRVGGR